MSTKATPRGQVKADRLREIDTELSAIGDPVAKERLLAEAMNKILDDQKKANEDFDRRYAEARAAYRQFTPECARLTEQARLLREERKSLEAKAT